MIDTGYFIITDITGYTSFLTQSELDHAQHILDALFDSQLKSIGSPLVVSGFRGDAILCYAPEDSALDGEIIYSQICKIYEAFNSKIDEMQVDPPCSCRVCSTISLLDLKIFVHFGKYLLQTVGDREELLGSDVIVAHRMMKNNVVKDTGIKSYLLLTEAAYKHLGSSTIYSNFINYSETYDDIGQVNMLVTSLRNH
jgi:hypothetical protein